MGVQGKFPWSEIRLKATLPPSRKISPQDFRDLVEAHQSRVYSIAYRILQDRGTAEEVAQDVFLALYRNLERIESSEHLLAWLRRVAVQRATDACRHRASRVDFAADEFREDRLDASVPPDRNGSAATSGLSHVEQLVTSLPPMQRVVVLLRYQEDMLPAEIAALLSMPMGTVKSNLQRALKLLQIKLERQRKEVIHG